MDRWIEHIAEPKRLLLVWRPPLEVQARYHWAVGELSNTATGATFRYFHGSEFGSYNDGKAEEELASIGFRGYPSFVWGARERSMYEEDVLFAFLRRLPPRRRSDFSDYLRHFRVDPDVRLDDFTLLGLTGARLPSDGFYLLDPLDPTIERCELVIESVGFRHRDLPAEILRVPSPIRLLAEPQNEHDPNAVRVELDGQKIGYVSRLQARTMQRWLSTRVVGASLVRVFGSPPRPLIFVTIAPRLDLNAA